MRGGDILTERGDLERLRREFDAWANSYDDAMHDPTGVLDGYAEARVRAAQLVLVRPGDTVADIGVGTGLFGELFASQGARIIGVDLSPRMLEVCSSKHPDWRCLEGDFLSLPLDDESVDLAISAFAFHHLETNEWPAALQEITRIVRGGRPFLLLDILFPDEPAKDAARQFLADEWEEENYPVYPDLARAAAGIGLATSFTQITRLHSAVLFQPSSD